MSIETNAAAGEFLRQGRKGAHLDIVIKAVSFSVFFGGGDVCVRQMHLVNWTLFFEPKGPAGDHDFKIRLRARGV